MIRKVAAFAAVAREILAEIFVTFRRQALTRGYLLALAVFAVAMLFAFFALSPILYAFVYPLF